jgi:broad specificity phosphatase PhoE
MKKVLLIRHGESQHNASGECFSGHADIPLSSVGREQAKQLRPLLTNVSIDEVYVSPLHRAKETASLAMPGFSQFKEDDSVIRRWKYNPASLCFPHGGCISHHADQALKGLEELVDFSSKTVLACFSHKTTIRLIVSKVLGLPLDYFRRVPCGNASITVLRFDQGKFSVESINVSAEFFIPAHEWRTV